MMRHPLFPLWALFALFAAASEAVAQKVVLIPLDNRPASGQYAELVGRIGGAEVVTPPMRLLGNYTIPGQPEAILKWLAEQDLSDCQAIVASTDMLCYGSLFESRKHAVSPAKALSRLQSFLKLRARAPKAKLYLFSCIMRLAPSATHDAGAYRMALARYVELRSRGGSEAELASLRRQIPKGALESYEAARRRNHRVQLELTRLASRPDIDLLVLGQDDAAAHGPHVAERAALAKAIGASKKVLFCEGADQISSLLVARALAESSGVSPSVSTVYSDPRGHQVLAQFESQPLGQTVRDQIACAGGRLETGEADYRLFVNTPDRSHGSFRRFLDELTAGLDAGKPLAVADTHISRTGGAPDAELYTALAERGRPMRLLAYAAWNTAANSIGTAVAAAQARVIALRSERLDEAARVRAELAHKQFVLYRMTNDFAYHSMTRPVAFGMSEGPRKNAIFGQELHEVNDFVQRDLSKFLRKAFHDSFLGREFEVGETTYRLIGLSDLAIALPWPRPYEVRLEFELHASPVESLLLQQRRGVLELSGQA